MLTEVERKILPELELNAELPSTDLAKRLNLPVHSLRYAVQRLLAKGVIVAYPFIDVHPLGYRISNLYFAVDAGAVATRNRLLSAIKENPQVSWIAELGGEYNYCASFVTRGDREVLDFIESLSAAVPHAITRKTVCQQLNLSLFPAKFLNPGCPRKSAISWGEDSEIFDADDTDYRVLQKLMEGGFQSNRNLARALGLPASTVDGRIEKLRKAKIFKGVVYLRNTQLMGTVEYKIFVSVFNRSAVIRRKFYDFAVAQPNVITFVELIGAWDYEIGVEVESPSAVSGVCDALRLTFGAELSRVDVVPLLRELKVACFPIKYEPVKVRLVV